MQCNGRGHSDQEDTHHNPEAAVRVPSERLFAHIRSGREGGEVETAAMAAISCNDLSGKGAVQGALLSLMQPSIREPIGQGIRSASCGPRITVPSYTRPLIIPLRRPSTGIRCSRCVVFT